MKKNDAISSESSFSETMNENSMNVSESSFSSPISSSISSSLSEDLADDAISSATSLPTRGGGGGGGALYQFADLMAQLPVKKGLSKYYDGKSESFRSLLSVKSVEDLAKKMKSRKSYGSNLNRHKFCAKATIAKKSPKRSSNIMAARIWL